MSKNIPGVIVIHEIFGLNDDIRRITGMVADLGYAALAPDLYDRDGFRLICIARTLMTLNRGEGDAFKDLDAARKFLQQQPGVDAARIGVIGFCMGGGFALMFAARAPLGVAATFYGDVPKTTEQLRGVCPVLGGYGGQDRIYAAHGRRLEKLLTEMGVDHDVKIYDDAGHSFMSRNRGFLRIDRKNRPDEGGLQSRGRRRQLEAHRSVLRPPFRPLGTRYLFKPTACRDFAIRSRDATSASTFLAPR